MRLLISDVEDIDSGVHGFRSLVYFDWLCGVWR